jgi:hypothetical protein
MEFSRNCHGVVQTAIVYQSWEAEYENSPAFGYIMGMLAFGLEESNFYEQAEKFGRQVIERRVFFFHSLLFIKGSATMRK